MGSEKFQGATWLEWDWEYRVKKLLHLVHGALATYTYTVHVQNVLKRH